MSDMDIPPPQSTGSDPANPAPTAAWADAIAQATKLKDFAAYYAAAKADALKVSVRNVVMVAALGVVAAIVALTALITATVLLCAGLAGALGALMGHTGWLGSLAFGVLVLVIAGLGLWLAMRLVVSKSRAATVEKYKAWTMRQRERFGTDVHAQSTK